MQQRVLRSNYVSKVAKMFAGSQQIITGGCEIHKRTNGFKAMSNKKETRFENAFLNALTQTRKRKKICVCIACALDAYL